jgi:protoheme ferro-lyase
MTVEALYAESIKPLTAAERLRLATLILKDIPPQSVVDYREEWNEEDLADFTKQSWINLEEQETTT